MKSVVGVVLVGDWQAQVRLVASSTSRSFPFRNISNPPSEGRAHRELEGPRGLEWITAGVPGVDETERHVEHGHDEAQLGAGRGTQLPEVDVRALREGLARVVEEQQAQGPRDVEVVLRVEER